VIEAALYAWNAAPGLGRRFAISRLGLASSTTEAAVREELRAAIDTNREIHIGGSDGDANAISLAKQNLEYARKRIVTGEAFTKSRSGSFVSASNASEKSGAPANADSGTATSGAISFTCMPLSEAKSALPEGFIITNPPYGKRLGDTAGAEAGYRDMAVLAKNFPGWKLDVICDHEGFESHFGKKANSCRNFKNGALDTFLYEYEKL
jgi:putative N6-adenine-specific DNA methylase